ncbi:MAG: hypothetical protein LBD71_03145 [Treponema sp.]|nr:hypothetical protein [Treponema sp.]
MTRSVFPFLLFFSAALFAQDVVRTDLAYLVPQTVYVGDRAALVIPLSGAAGNAELPLPPETEDVVFHRARVESRGGEGRVFIEFTAYAPGLLAFPPVEVPTGFLTGLRVEIASILERGNEGRVLSDPAPPLAAPGTGLFIYGTAACLLLGLFFFLGGTRWFRSHFRTVLGAWKRRRLIGGMLSLTRRLRREMLKNPAPPDSESYGKLFDFLSVEFRSFLALYTGLACRAMTAPELGMIALPPEVPAPGGLVRRWDERRYGALGVKREELLDMLEEIRLFAGTLEKAERMRELKAGHTDAAAAQAAAVRATGEGGRL